MKQNSAQTEIVVNKFFKHLSEADALGMESLFSDQIEWLVSGNPALPWTGTRTKKSDVSTYFNTMWPHFLSPTGESRIEKLIISREDAIMLGVFSLTAASTGRSWNTPVAMHFLVEDGKITRLYLYEDTWAVSKAFFD